MANVRQYLFVLLVNRCNTARLLLLQPKAVAMVPAFVQHVPKAGLRVELDAQWSLPH